MHSISGCDPDLPVPRSCCRLLAADYDPELFPPIPSAQHQQHTPERGGSSAGDRRQVAERDDEREAFNAELERVAAELERKEVRMSWLPPPRLCSGSLGAVAKVGAGSSRPCSELRPELLVCAEAAAQPGWGQGAVWPRAAGARDGQRRWPGDAGITLSSG